MWLKSQQAPKLAQVQAGQMPWQKCSTKRFHKISPPSWPRIKNWRRREKRKNKKGWRRGWRWEKDAVFCCAQSDGDICNSLSAGIWESALRLSQFSNLSSTVISSSLKFYFPGSHAVGLFPSMLFLDHQAGWLFAAGLFQSVSLRCFGRWEGKSSCFKLSFLFAIVNLGYNSLCQHYELK